MHRCCSGIHMLGTASKARAGPVQQSQQSLHSRLALRLCTRSVSKGTRYADCVAFSFVLCFFCIMQLTRMPRECLEPAPAELEACCRPREAAACSAMHAGALDAREASGRPWRPARWAGWHRPTTHPSARVRGRLRARPARSGAMSARAPRRAVQGAGEAGGAGAARQPVAAGPEDRGRARVTRRARGAPALRPGQGPRGGRARPAARRRAGWPRAPPTAEARRWGEASASIARRPAVHSAACGSIPACGVPQRPASARPTVAQKRLAAQKAYVSEREGVAVTCHCRPGRLRVSACLARLQAARLGACALRLCLILGSGPSTLRERMWTLYSQHVSSRL